MSQAAIFRVWVGLMVATAVTWWMGDSGSARVGGVWVLAAIFGLAFVKGRWIALDFMELRGAPALWRRLMMGWLVGVTGVIVACALWTLR